MKTQFNLGLNVVEGPLFTYKNNAPGGGLKPIGGRHYRCEECGVTVTADCECCEVQHRCEGKGKIS